MQLRPVIQGVSYPPIGVGGACGLGGPTFSPEDRNKTPIVADMMLDALGLTPGL